MADKPSPEADPLTMWREWVAQSERQWNSFMNNAMATDEFSRSLGQFMDVYLGMQKSLNDSMGRYFSAINIPTRQDVLGLGDRLSAIEERLTAIESSLSKLTPEGPPAATRAAPVARPPRTKKPAKS